MVPLPKLIKSIKVKALLLAAGKGTRLETLTEEWPKCLMPIGSRPLLEYWLATCFSAGVNPVMVNLHHHADIVADFLQRPCFRNWVIPVREEFLLGTAGTLYEHRKFFRGHTTLLAHSDNWCQCAFDDFFDFHFNHRPEHCPITMMTFDTSAPKSCGIVELDHQGVVVGFHEKAPNPPGVRANGAVYLLDPEFLEWLESKPYISDFSTEVIPAFIGNIATWHNAGIHKDIGVPKMLIRAQDDPRPHPIWPQEDSWNRIFETNPIHEQIQVIRA